MDLCKWKIIFVNQESRLNRKLSPFGWWSTNKEKFPTLAKLARRYLPSPMSSVASEREFKQAKRINSGREQLKPKNLEMLLFIKFNLRMVDYDY